MDNSTPSTSEYRDGKLISPSSQAQLVQHPKHEQFSDRLFMPLLASLFTIIIVLFGVGVRYGDFDHESSLGAANLETDGALSPVPTVFPSPQYAVQSCL